MALFQLFYEMHRNVKAVARVDIFPRVGYCSGMDKNIILLSRANAYKYWSGVRVYHLPGEYVVRNGVWLYIPRCGAKGTYQQFNNVESLPRVAKHGNVVTRVCDRCQGKPPLVPPTMDEIKSTLLNRLR